MAELGVGHALLHQLRQNVLQRGRLAGLDEAVDDADAGPPWVVALSQLFGSLLFLGCILRRGLELVVDHS
jgi:hypothetical protein